MSAVHLQQLISNLRRTVEANELDTLPDAELLDRFRSVGDAAAFETIVRRYGARVLAAGRQVLTDQADVDDMFQATFLVLLKEAGRIRKRESLGGWLFGVAHRLALQARASAARRSRVEARKPSLLQEDADDLSWREACAILHEELDRLPDTYRLPLLLCYLDGRTRDEAAQQLGVNAEVVRGRLERGRDKLRARLMQRGVTLSTGLLTAVAASATAGGPSAFLIQTTISAAFTGSTSITVGTLVQGAVSSMTIFKFKLMAAIAVTVGLVSSGVYMATPAAQPIPAAPAMAKNGTQPASEEKAAPAAKEEKDAVDVSGQVLDPNGNALAGVKLYIPHLKQNPPMSIEDFGAEQIAMTGADGRFAFSYKNPSNVRGYLVAYKEGFGVDWVEVPSLKAAEKVVLKLVKDQPISGRILDTEGKPLAGVSVTVASILVPPNDKLDDYLTGWKKNWRDTNGALAKHLYFTLDNIVGKTTTDKDGRFKLLGAGIERVVMVQFQDKGIAGSMPHILTREGLDPKPLNEAAFSQELPEFRIKGQIPILYGPEATFVVEAGKVVEGIVKDLTTGKPLARFTVNAMFGHGDGRTALTDTNGKYRLEGLPQDKTYRVYVLPPAKSDYLRRGVDATATPGAAPVHIDVELAKGIVVSGRVIDRQTGKGVEAGIRFAPLPDNKYFGKPGFDSYKSDRTMETTDKEGRFRVVTIPGKSLLMVQIHGRDKVDGLEIGPYMQARPDPEHKDLFKYDKEDDTWMFTGPNGALEFLNIENIIKVIDLKEDGGEVKLELFAERGQTAKLIIQDADGKPLSGVFVSGLTAQWPPVHKLPKETPATVYALNPEHPRRLVLLHQEKKLGGTVTMHGDEKEPVVIKLAALGSVSARLLDIDGAPLIGAAVSVNYPDRVASELNRALERTSPTIVTDKEGRFTLEGVVPGMKFYLQMKKGENYYMGEPRIGLHEVEPGKTKDLGDHKVKPQN